MEHLPDYKSRFINFLFDRSALQVGNDFKLKSGRIAPYFINIAALDDGEGIGMLTDSLAEAIRVSGLEFNVLYGIPEKGVALAPATALQLATKQSTPVRWFFTRKHAKGYGEASSASPDDIRRKLIVGHIPSEGEKILYLDDVLTTGDTKQAAISDIRQLFPSTLHAGVAVVVDRQEVGIDGVGAVEAFVRATSLPVVSVITALDILSCLEHRTDVSPPGLCRMRTYLQVYGTKEVQRALCPPPVEITNISRSVIPSCDVPTIEQFEDIVRQTHAIEKIGGYKVGFELGLRYSLPKVVETARRYTNKPIIYDHQKAGTDIPDTGKNFARVCKDAGIDAVIFFPQAGPETERAWIYHALDCGLKVIIGGRMTHAGYSHSEGGFISDDGALEMYRIAARAGIQHFVVPGNKPAVIAQVKSAIEAEGIRPVFFAPGFVAQGGTIEEATTIAGDSWHAIVGRGIYEARDMRKAALDHTSKL